MSISVVSVTPPDGSQGRALSQTVIVHFNDLVDESTIDAGSFILTQTTMVGLDELLNKDDIAATTVVSGTYTFDVVDNKSVVTFTPGAPLAQNASFQAILSTSIKGQDDSNLDSIYKWSFETTASGVITPPGDASDIAQVPYRSTWVTPLTAPREVYLEAVSANPSNGSSNLPISTSIVTIEFNKALDPNILTTKPWQLVALPVDGDPALNQSSGLLSYSATIIDDKTLKFTITQTKTPLFKNNLVTITFGNIAATDGSTVEEPPLEYFFTTTYDPLYTTARMVRSRIGAFINEVRDDTINLAIYDASRITEYQIPTIPEGLAQAYIDQIEFWKTEYAKVCACLTVLLNSPSIAFRQKSKLIGDMEVTWQQSKIIEKMVDQLYAQRDYLDNYISNLALFPQKAQMSIKGAMDWDRPLIGRDVYGGPWEPPAANANFFPPYSRRKIKTWWPTFGNNKWRKTW